MLHGILPSASTSQKTPALPMMTAKRLVSRAADAVAKFGGWWTLIILFGVVLICWVMLNSFILANYNKTFDLTLIFC